MERAVKQSLANGRNTLEGASNMTRRGSPIPARQLFKLTVAGGLAFWASTIVISLLPIAAEYRAAFGTRSWSMQTVWVASLFMGMLIGLCVSYALLRSLHKTPAADPVLRSAKLGFFALVIATILIDVPQSWLSLGPGEVWQYFLVGVALNAPRFLLLGLAIGYVYQRQHGSSRA
jgi:hypothetical protein